MTIATGTASDSAPTGLAGRLAAAIKAAFTGTTYPAGGVGVKGIDAMAAGIVAALNNDKIDLTTQTSGGASGSFEEIPLGTGVGDGSTAAYPLAHFPANLVLLDVWVAGARYSNGIEYNYSVVNVLGTLTPTVTFVAGFIPLATDTIRARYPY